MAGLEPRPYRTKITHLTARPYCQLIVNYSQWWDSAVSKILVRLANRLELLVAVSGFSHLAKNIIKFNQTKNP